MSIWNLKGKTLAGPRSDQGREAVLSAPIKLLCFSRVLVCAYQIMKIFWRLCSIWKFKPKGTFVLTPDKHCSKWISFTILILYFHTVFSRIFHGASEKKNFPSFLTFSYSYFTGQIQRGFSLIPEVFAFHPEAAFHFNCKDFWHFEVNFFSWDPEAKHFKYWTSKRPVEHLIPLKICICLSLYNS